MKEAGDLNVKLATAGSTRTDVASAPPGADLTSVKLVNTTPVGDRPTKRAPAKVAGRDQIANTATS